MRKQTPQITLAECLAHRCSVSGYCYCHYHSQRLFLIISIFINNNSFLIQMSQIETKCDNYFLTYLFPLDYVKIKWKLVIVLLYSGNQEIFAHEWNSYFRVPKPHSFCTENQEPLEKAKTSCKSIYIHWVPLKYETRNLEVDLVPALTEYTIQRQLRR